MCKTILILAVLLQLCFNGVVQFGNSTRLLKQNYDVDLKNIKGTESNNVEHGHPLFEMKSSRSPPSGPNRSTNIPSPPEK